MKVPDINQFNLRCLLKDFQQEACANSICPDISCNECIFHNVNYKEFLKWLEEDFPKLIALEKENKDAE